MAINANKNSDWHHVSLYDAADAATATFGYISDNGYDLFFIVKVHLIPRRIHQEVSNEQNYYESRFC